MKKLIILVSVFTIALSIVSPAQTHDHQSMVKNQKDGAMKCCEDTGNGSSKTGCKMELGELIKSSMKMKDAFVSSDVELAGLEASNVLSNLEKIDMTQLIDEECENGIKLFQSMGQNLKNIIASKDINLQRSNFAAYNESLFQSVKLFGFKGEKLYYDYCPMALNNNGAYWLSTTEEIRNPYFGEKMLSCGKVKETIN